MHPSIGPRGCLLNRVLLRSLFPTPLPWSLMSPSSESVLIDAARHLRRWSAAQLARESGLAMGTIQEALSPADVVGGVSVA